MKQIIKLTTIIVTFMVITLFVLDACKTNEDILEQYSDQIQQKRSQLNTIAESLPPLGSVEENSYCEGEDNYTAALFMDYQLIDPNEFGFNVDNYLERELGRERALLELLKGPSKYGYDGYGYSTRKFLEERDDDRFKPFLEETLSVKYIVVNRVVEHIPSETVWASSGLAFIPGYVTLEGFMISLENNQILCQYNLTATIEDEEVHFHYRGRNLYGFNHPLMNDPTTRQILSRDSKKEEEAAKKKLEQLLQYSARAELDKVLEEITLGKYKLATNSFYELTD